MATRGPTRRKPGVPRARRREVYTVHVDSALHGSGVAQGLLDTVLRPGASAELWVWSGNARAQRFYRRNGFEPDGAAYVDERFPELESIVRLVR